MKSITKGDGLCPEFQPRVLQFTCSQCEHALSPSSAMDQHPDEVRKAVRGLLRFGGHKPSGRGRPASESLLKALSQGKFPDIHPVVDSFNALSVDLGVPISVLDRNKLVGELGFRLGQAEEAYIFNPSGQELRLKGLVLLHDENGPSGTPVKDAQRTKIQADSEEFLVVLWRTSELPEVNARLDSAIEEWAANNLVALEERAITP